MNAYKMHEVRMWTVQVIIPTILVGGYILFCTDIPKNVKAKINEHRENRKNRRKEKC